MPERGEGRNHDFTELKDFLSVLTGKKKILVKNKKNDEFNVDYGKYDWKNRYCFIMNEKNNPTKQTKVAMAVLRGATIPNTAKEYGISKTNCKRMVDIYCAKSDHSLYDTLRDYPFGDFNIPITKLRKYANHFINKSRCNDGQVAITEQSSIWDLPKVQTLALNALWQRNIKTVADILKYDERKLLRLPKLGKIGLQQLKDVLEKYNLEIAEGR